MSRDDIDDWNYVAYFMDQSSSESEGSPNNSTNSIQILSPEPTPTDNSDNSTMSREYQGLITMIQNMGASIKTNMEDNSRSLEQSLQALETRIGDNSRSLEQRMGENITQNLQALETRIEDSITQSLQILETRMDGNITALRQNMTQVTDSLKDSKEESVLLNKKLDNALEAIKVNQDTLSAQDQKLDDHIKNQQAVNQGLQETVNQHNVDLHNIQQSINKNSDDTVTRLAAINCQIDQASKVTDVKLEQLEKKMPQLCRDEVKKYVQNGNVVTVSAGTENNGYKIMSSLGVYDDATRGIHPVEFIKQLGLIHDMGVHTWSIFKIQLEAHFRHEPLYWFRTHSNLFEDFADFKEKFLRYFWNFPRQQQLLAEITGNQLRYRHGGSLCTFAASIRHKNTFLDHPLTEPSLVWAIIEKLPREVQIALCNPPPTSYQQLESSLLLLQPRYEYHNAYEAHYPRDNRIVRAIEPPVHRRNHVAPQDARPEPPREEQAHKTYSHQKAWFKRPERGPTPAQTVQINDSPPTTSRDYRQNVISVIDERNSKKSEQDKKGKTTPQEKKDMNLGLSE